MIIGKLTLAKIARISKQGKYGDGNGLYLLVSKSLTKSWMFRYQHNGVERYIRFGPLCAVPLNKAREKAIKARICLARKRDPFKKPETRVLKNKKNNKPDKTFDECAIQYIAHHKMGWKSAKYLKQWESALRTYASPYFGKMLVRTITTAHVLRALKPIWLKKPETASRLRGYIERILSWATISGCRKGDNPARWNKHLQEILLKPSRIKTVRHHPSLPYQEVGAFLKRLNTEKGIAARALEFTVLTACRTSESLYARWEEINFQQRIWIIPGARMKNGRPHRVPLADAALRILLALKGLNPEWVFPNPKRGLPYCASGLRSLLRKMHRTDISVHGFRATFRVWTAERAYPRELAEMALAHKQATAVEAAYQRSDLFERRRTLMQDWADWCFSSQ